MLRRIFGPKREEVTGEWRNLHEGNSIIYILPTYYEDYHIKEDNMGGTCKTHRRDEKCIQHFSCEI
jgi:hypothetical protein